MFVFSLHINAVFEGRNEKLQEYTTVRNSIEVEPFNISTTQKAEGMAPGIDRTPQNSTTPISDIPLIFLFLGGAAYGAYIMKKKQKKKCLVCQDR